MRYYTFEMLERAYRREYPEMSEEEIQQKALALHKKMDQLDAYWRRNNRQYYSKAGGGSDGP